MRGFVSRSTGLLLLAMSFMARGLEARSRKIESPFNLRAPAGDLPAKVDPASVTILPNGRFITARGTQVMVAPHPYGLALSSDGSTLVTSNSGTHPFSISIITGIETGAE